MEDKFRNIYKNLGTIDKRLIEGLREIFKPVSIVPNTKINQIMFNAGQMSVIELLQRIHDGENK